MKLLRCLAPALLALPLLGQPVANVLLKPGRDAAQAVDEEYTKKIREYTTEPFFNSPLTDYLPASKTVPTPKAVLGDIAGAPGILPYSAEVYRYMRMLEKASPRVKVFSIGKTEEGREMIAVAVASETPAGHSSTRTAPAWPSSPTRAPSSWTTPRPKNWSPRPRPSTTSPAPSTPPKPARPPR